MQHLLHSHPEATLTLILTLGLTIALALPYLSPRPNNSHCPNSNPARTPNPSPNSNRHSNHSHEYHPPGTDVTAANPLRSFDRLRQSSRGPGSVEFYAQLSAALDIPALIMHDLSQQDMPSAIPPSRIPPARPLTLLTPLPPSPPFYLSLLSSPTRSLARSPPSSLPPQLFFLLRVRPPPLSRCAQGRS